MRWNELPLALGAACLIGCASAAAPLQPRTVPASVDARVAAADTLGERLFAALRGPGVPSLLADGASLDALYRSAARARLLQEQAFTRQRYPGAPWATLWRDHAYAGVCLQGGQPRGGTAGLRAPAWVVDRVLVVARRGRWRTAAWVTGTFVLTSEGFQTIAISQIEPPRPGHADLELAPCDVQRGL